MDGCVEVQTYEHGTALYEQEETNPEYTVVFCHQVGCCRMPIRIRIVNVRVGRGGRILHSYRSQFAMHLAFNFRLVDCRKLRLLK